MQTADLETGVRRLVMTVICLTLYLSICLLAIDLPPINLIFLMPANDSKAAANYTAPAITVAVNRIKEELILPSNADIRWMVSETLRPPMLTADNFQKVYTDEHQTISAIFGGFCSGVCGILSSISAALNVSYVGVDCNVDTMKLSSHKRPPSFVTMSYWRPSLAPLLNFVMDSFGWTRVAVLATSDEESSYYGRTIMDSVQSKNNTAFLILCTLSELEENKKFTEEDLLEIDRILDDMTKQARVFFFAMESDVAGRILIAAQKKGLYNGQYAFIGTWLEWVSARILGSDAAEWELARAGLITLEPSYVKRDPRFIRLVNQVPRVDPHLSWIRLQYLTDGDRRWEYLAKDLYTAVLLFAYALNKTIAKGKGSTPIDVLQNGSIVMEQAREMSVIGLPDIVYFDDQGVRRSNWSVKNLMKNGEGRILVDFDKDMKMLRTGDMSMVTWPGGGNKVPLDHPECGWDNEKCKTSDWIFTVVYIVIGCFAFLCAVLALFLWRRMKIRMERRTLEEWKVNWSRVTVIGDNIVGRLSTHEMYPNKMSLEAASQADSSETRNNVRSAHYRLFTLAGFYKGKMVAIKKIQRESVDIYQKTIYNELKQLFYISHENVNPFIGVCAEAPNVCLLMLYADRGSLQDVLADPKYDINWEFRACLTMDIVQGMEYLHESPIGPHGHLTSSNCVVDSKWECRITDYGLKHFKRNKKLESSTFKWSSDLLWTAPEILQKPETDRSRIYGTKEGDVYSFGIIVSELITKQMPYHSQLESMTPEEVVRTMTEGATLRPVLPSSEDPIIAEWNKLAAHCWHQLPEVRPTFKTARIRLRHIVGGKAHTLMHRMQTLLQEGLERKTTEIANERRKTETIFHNLLPKSVADDIIAGNEVRPQRFESVTVCLCETIGLYSAKNLSPVQMTELLNSLYRVYDGIIQKYNVTEVSSRGTRELMILGSGLPQHTERHAEDICDLSLDLISEASAFKTPLVPQFSVSLKISVHTGQVIAAVMGEMVPKYHVVGEAVQTVNDMHVTSKALGTRISETTYDRISKSGSYTVGRGENVTLKDLSTLKTFWISRKSGHKESLKTSPRKKRRSSPVVKPTGH